MVTAKDYVNYFGSIAPENLKRLEYLAINELRSIMVANVPTSDELIYGEFKRAILEQINYFVVNEDLLVDDGNGGYTLGSYHEGTSNQNDKSKNKSLISKEAYKILLNIGVLYSGLGGCCHG